MSSSNHARKKVNFITEPAIRFVERSRRLPMAKQIFETFDGHEVTDDMLREAAVLFNENYGIWGTAPENFGRIPKQGESQQAQSGYSSHIEDRNSCEAKQRTSTSPVSTRECRLLLREGYNWGPTSRERVCLSVESQGQTCMLDYSTCRT